MNWRYLLPYAAILALAAATAWYLHGASLPVLDPKGPVGAAELRVMIITVLLCAIVVVPVFILLFYFAWKYRAGNTATHVDHSPDWDHDNWVAETIWWLVPAAIIAFLAVLAWQSSYALDPYKPLASAAPPLTVQVVALDWKWLFIYPEQGIASVNLVEFPADVPVRFELTADAPMNSFWVPSLGGQIMVMPGMQTQLNLMASRVGDYQGASANISGGRHSIDMCAHFGQRTYGTWCSVSTSGNERIADWTVFVSRTTRSALCAYRVAESAQTFSHSNRRATSTPTMSTSRSIANPSRIDAAGENSGSSMPRSFANATAAAAASA